MSLDPSIYVYENFREAVRRGFPVYAKRLVRGAILARNERGKGVFFSRLIEEESGTLLVVAGREQYTIWNVKMARIRPDGSIVEYFPYNVPGLVSQYITMLSTWEADVWTRRLALVDKAQPISSREAPEAVRKVAMEKNVEHVLYVKELEDYALERSGVVVAWVNVLTGAVDDAEEYAKSMGLL